MPAAIAVTVGECALCSEETRNNPGPVRGGVGSTEDRNQGKAVGSAAYCIGITEPLVDLKEII